MPRRNTTLSTKQVVALTALLSGSSVEQAAKDAGVHRGTVWSWRTQAGPFRTALLNAQSEVLHRTMAYLGQTGPAAAATLGSLLREEVDGVDAEGSPTKVRQPEGVRARAAAVLLKELREFSALTSLEERMRQLESLAESREQGREW